MDYTNEYIMSLSHEARFDLRKKLQAAVATIEIVEEADPDLFNVHLDDYMGTEMTAVINSPKGLEAIQEAIAADLPPLAGIDPLLRAALGPFYTSKSEGGIQAGYLVWKCLKELGYTQGSEKKLPAGCAAQTGTMAVKS